MNTLFVDLLTRHGITPPTRRGMVRCIFHQEKTPSLSIDTERGLFHCFGCGVAGGMKGFAALVGEPIDNQRYSPRTRARIAVQTRRRTDEGQARAILQKMKDREDTALWSAWGEATTTAHEAAELLSLFFRRPDLARAFPALVHATSDEYAAALWQKMLVEQRHAGEVSHAG